jgi:hypothetical protein
MDIGSIGSMLSSLNAAKNIGQAMLEMKVSSDVQTKVIELQSQILGATSSALDAKTECIELVEENARVRHQLRQLQDQIAARNGMTFEYNVYWRSNGSISEGPFCPRCFDGESQRAARMSIVKDPGFWRCPVCGCFEHMPGSSRLSGQAETDWDPNERI